MIWAQSIYKTVVNKKQTPVPAYQIGDFVWLNIRNLNTKRPAKKLNQKNTGPYKVKKVVSSYTYWLKLFDIVKIHFIFYMLVLRLAASILDTLLGQIQDPPLPVKVDGEDKYFIERINNIKYDKQKCQYIYLIKQKGYTKPL